MRPLLVSITIAFALSRLAGSGWATAGSAQTSAAKRARMRIMKTPDQEVEARAQARAGKSSDKRPRQRPNLVLRLAATDGGTNADTFPPIAAICRTSVAVIGRTATEAGRNTVCTSEAMVLFMTAICI